MIKIDKEMIKIIDKIIFSINIKEVMKEVIFLWSFGFSGIVWRINECVQKEMQN